MSHSQSHPLLLTLLWLSACSPRDVVVADLPGGPKGTGTQPVAGSGGAPPGGNGGSGLSGAGGAGACASTADCSDIELCVKATCSDASGHCELRPLTCGNESIPVCGCDGVTYWNDCLRRQNGTESMVANQCAQGAAPCGGPANGSCRMSRAVCAQLLPPGAPCGSGPRPGVCWLLPDSCPTNSGPERWQSCDPAQRCGDMCGAMRMGGPFQRAQPGACP